MQGALHAPVQRLGLLLRNLSLVHHGSFPLLQEGEEQELLAAAPATSLCEKEKPNPEKERVFLMKSVSLPTNLMLPKSVSLSMPCPSIKEGRRLWARLPSILASLAVIALVVLSAPWRSAAAAPPGPVTSAAAQLPRKFLSKCALLALRVLSQHAVGCSLHTGRCVHLQQENPQAHVCELLNLCELLGPTRFVHLVMGTCLRA